MMKQPPQSALSVLLEFLSADLVHRDADRALALLSADVWWYGTGDEEDVHNAQEAKRYLESEIQAHREPYQLEYLEQHDQTRQNGGGVAYVKCRVTGGGVSMVCRCSATVESKDAKIDSLHMSVPDTTQREGEFFPFSLAEQYERELYQEFLNEMIDGGMLGWYDDPSEELYLVNRQLLDFLGYPSEADFRERIGSCAANAVFPDDREKSSAQIREQLRKQNRYRVEYRLLRRDGGVIWVESHGKRVTAKNGRTALIGIINDISEQKRTALLAKTQDQEIRNLYDTIPGGVFICKFDSDWDVTFANKGFYDFLGYTREEFETLFQNKMIGVIYPDDQESVRRTVQEQLARGNRIENTNRLVCRGGVVKWISIHAILSPDERNGQSFYCTFVEITGQKEAEEKLRESEKRYRFAIEGAGVDIWEYDIARRRMLLPANSLKARDGNLIVENCPDSLMETLGISSRQQEEMRSLFRRIEAGETKVSGDFWVDNPKTHTRWCERVTYAVALDEKGQPQKAYGASFDVTQSKLAEKRYQEELAYRNHVMESVISTCCVNLTARKVESVRVDTSLPVDKERAKALDYRERTLSYLYDSEMTDEQNARLSPEKLLQSYNNGVTALSEEYTARMRQNHYCWLRVDVNLVKHPETGSILAFFYNRDLTDRIIRNKVMDTVLTNDYEEVGTVDFRTGLYRKSAGGNSAMKLGQECDYTENIELFCQKRVSPPDWSRMRKILALDHLRAAIEQNDPYEVQFLGITGKGERRFTLMRFQLLGGSCDMMLITRRDIDELVRKEQGKQRQLEQAVKAANAANRVKSEFLSRMSHEIRTPLNAILGMSLLGTEAPDVRAAGGYFKDIHDSGTFLLGIINDILDMSRIEQGKLEMHEELVNGREFLRGIDVIVRPLAEVKGVRLVTDYSKAQTPWVYMDKLRSQQIYVNLLNNAIKFSRPGGTVEWTVTDTPVDATHFHMVSTVRDHGCGMSKGFMSHLFEPFYQEHNGLTDERMGTGLGLAIVKSIIDQMGGTIRVESEIGKGSVFSFELDREYRMEAPGEPGIRNEGNPLEKLKGRTILLCEDQPLNVRVAKRLLERAGMRVLTAENGEIALERFAASSPGEIDLILMDIRMPVMDGLEATRRIRALPRADAAGVPIVAMTANAFEQDRKLSSAAGMNAHLSKPIEPELLYDTLARFL